MHNNNSNVCFYGEHSLCILQSDAYIFFFICVYVYVYTACVRMYDASIYIKIHFCCFFLFLTTLVVQSFV